MGKIVILDENTANKIAAGEVVERPASVVKELIENSIDADSDNICIEIKNGGIKYIKISDNGMGILQDDVEIAFERHATSKIRGSNDLDCINTLGFRGEALSSIASVSTVELSTKIHGEQYGRFVKVQGGKLIESKQIGCSVGTTFIVENLFYNTPARYKFLKKDSTEAGYVADIVNRIAIGNPDISFKFINKNSVLLHTPGNGDLLSCIFSVYGKDIAKNVLKVDYMDEDVRITGYVGKPEVARANRSFQSLYINKRYFKSKVVSAAIDQANKTILLKNKHPFIVLNIEVNPANIDVNVHPTKTEIRFSNEQSIFSAVYHSICNALHGENLFGECVLKEQEKNTYKFCNNENRDNSYEQQNLDICKKEESLNIGTCNLEIDAKEVGSSQFEVIADRKFDKDIGKTENIGKFENSEQKESVKVNEEVEEYKISNLPKASNEKVINKEITDVTKKYKHLEEEKYERSNAGNAIDEILSQAQIIGQLFSTYILLQHKENFMLLDQHAGHERIMFEEIKKRYKDCESIAQPLLSPLVVQLSTEEMRYIIEEKEFLQSLGYIYEDFGNNSIILREVPYIHAQQEIKELFLEILNDIMAVGNSSNRLILSERVLYSMACKSAVKANKKLDEIEIRSMLSKLSKLNNPYTCPHGRPTIIRITKVEIEKMFKRII